MRKSKRSTGLLAPLMTMMLVCVGFLCAGCINVNPYDENSYLHAQQAERNEKLVDGGMDDAAINAEIDRAYALVDPPPAMPEDGTDTPEAAAWRTRREALMPLFSKIVRQWCFVDLERGIRINQADAWRAYEESKAPEEVEPPKLE